MATLSTSQRNYYLTHNARETEGEGGTVGYTRNIYQFLERKTTKTLSSLRTIRKNGK
jgi:hypothetical protein